MYKIGGYPLIKLMFSDVLIFPCIHTPLIYPAVVFRLFYSIPHWGNLLVTIARRTDIQTHNKYNTKEIFKKI